jgi:hypothetical protein
VGSKDFTEAILVAEMDAQLLELASFTVERKLNLGGTPVAHQALLKGDIDLYPEYNLDWVAGSAQSPGGAHHVVLSTVDVVLSSACTRLSCLGIVNSKIWSANVAGARGLFSSWTSRSNK